MYHLDIEREIHRLVLEQFLIRATQRKIIQRALAEKVGVTEVHLSRMKRGGNDWRPLTPERAKKIMEVLNYRSSQIKGVEMMLSFFKQKRTKRRHIANRELWSQVQTKCLILDDSEMHAVVMELYRKENNAKVFVLINCDNKQMNFYDAKKKEIDFIQTAKLLFGEKKNIITTFSKILLTLKDQWWKELASDLDNFDSEASTVRMQGRKLSIQNARGGMQIAQEASDIFENYLGLAAKTKSKLTKRQRNKCDIKHLQ
ncbi:helix-turn-helix transcriptional regulator [Candidatus Peregrinibacteria bacterium]|nr:helix-turn-helix transcriptional regulator [Candidatus Peregrinibacteria bacterium]